jgi:hypothetical protein
VNVEKGDGQTNNVYGTEFASVQNDMGAQVELGEVAVCANGHVWMLGTGDHQGKVFFNQLENSNDGQWFALPDKETFTWITCG